MNIVFMGTPDFAVPALEMLIKEGHTISAVVTQPDKPKGRGKALTMSPVKETALKYGLPVLQPVRIKNEPDFVAHIQSLNPDVIVVVAFGQILPLSVLEIPRYGCINIHGSLLPKYRGAAPIQWAILNEEAVTGVTIMYMAEGMDTGDMLYKKEIAIEETDTYETLHDKMKVIGAIALKEALPEIIAGGKHREVQDETQVTYASKIEKAMGEIDWQKSSSAIDAKVRGLNPWPGGYTYYKGQVMKIWKVKKQPKETQSEAPSGTILLVDKEGITVKTGDNCLLIEEIQMPNKKRMPVAEYIKGNTLEIGTRLGI